jgi:hypothetical protein
MKKILGTRALKEFAPATGGFQRRRIAISVAVLPATPVDPS